METRVTARIDPELKAEAEAVLTQLGLSTTDLIKLTLKQLVMRQGLPFDVRIPNEETQEAIAELQNPETRKKLKSFETVEDLMTDLNS